MDFVIGGVGFAAAMAVVALLKMTSKSEKIEMEEVINDFRVLRTAFIRYKKEESRLCEELKTLEPFMQEPREIDWSRYAITMDQKYMIVRDARSVPVDEIIKRLGSSTFVRGNKLYMSFSSVNAISKVEPVAKFRIIPNEGITTTTILDFDYSASVTEDNEISDLKWINMEKRYSEPGVKTIKLKVQDKNGNWSEWTSEQIVVKEVKGIQAVRSGHDFVYILHKNGKADGFGHNDFGQLGTGDNEFLERRKKLRMIENAMEIDGGADHAFYLTYDKKVMTLGRNQFGQLGLGDRSDSAAARQIWGLEGIVQISAGSNFGAALTATGQVYCWGNNEHGQLGTEPSYFKETPQRVEGIENIRAISCGSTHMLALGFNGNVYAWGDNRHGQLGLGFKGKHHEPSITSVAGMKSICAGNGFSLSISESGRVTGWGINSKSQLGMVGETEVLFPETILELKNVAQVATKGNFVVALDEIGHVWTWGHYTGFDETFPQKPARVADLKYIKSVAATKDAGYAVTESGDLVRWGQDIGKTENVLFFEEEPENIDFDIKENI